MSDNNDGLKAAIGETPVLPSEDSIRAISHGQERLEDNLFYVLKIQTRLVEDSERRLYEDLRWAGLDWDEGPDVDGPFGPYKQSERSSLYQTYGNQLLNTQHAYRCFCSVERLNAIARERHALGLPSEYDRTCVHIPKDESDERVYKGEPYVVRLKVPDVMPSFQDLVYGSVDQRRKRGPPSQRAQPSYEDPILLKSDGLPTYHLANVVDDHLMEITHVIRAVEWMSSTPKHVVMYNAFNWKPPIYAHVGLLQDSSRQKFSKRDLALDISSFRNDGIFAEALLNYVALFGWSHKLGDDFLGLQDLIQNFDLKFTKGNTIVAPNKLMYLQRRYAEKFVAEGGGELDSMVESLVTFADQHLESYPQTQIHPSSTLRHRVIAILRLDAANYTTPKEFFYRNCHLLFAEPRREYTRRPDDPLLSEGLGNLKSCFSDIPLDRWDEQNLKQAFERIFDELSPSWGLEKDPGKGCKASIQHFLRWALTGGRPGPVLVSTMLILGRDVSLKRIEDAVVAFDENLKASNEDNIES